MSKREHFQPVQFALLVHDATGEIFSGTISQRDLGGTRRLAESILKVMPRAATVWVHPWMGTTYAASCVEVVRRPASSELEVPMKKEETSDVQADPLKDIPLVEQEAVPDAPQVSSDRVGAEQPSVEPIPMKRRGRPPKVKQEA